MVKSDQFSCNQRNCNRNFTLHWNAYDIAYMLEIKYNIFYTVYNKLHFKNSMILSIVGHCSRNGFLQILKIIINFKIDFNINIGKCSTNQINTFIYTE